LASKAESYFKRVLASLPRRPSIDTMNGEKVPMLPEACLKVFLLFLTFMGCEHLLWDFEMV
jgi:hypothetical protein